MSGLHALTWLTADLLRQLLREPQVVRSLLWPIALVPLTLLLSVLGFVWVEGDWPVGVSDSAPAEVHAALVDGGFTVVTVTDPQTAVRDGGLRYATDGAELWTRRAAGRALQVERVLREQRGATWTVAPPGEPPSDEAQGGAVMGVIGVLFVLFGVVFGAGMVARDRDNGTLEAQLATGTPRWVHGAARWIAGSLVLTAHYLLAILVLRAILGVDGAWAVARNGFAACASGVGVGLLVIGRGGLKRGFSGPLAGGLSLATGAVALGVFAPSIGRWLPIASALTDSDGWIPLLGAAALGTLTTVTFTLRSARA